jgi:hypothetical protein
MGGFILLSYTKVHIDNFKYYISDYRIDCSAKLFNFDLLSKVGSTIDTDFNYYFDVWNHFLVMSDKF